MEIILLQDYAQHKKGASVNVSDARAQAMVNAGIAEAEGLEIQEEPAPEPAPVPDPMGDETEHAASSVLNVEPADDYDKLKQGGDE